MTRSHRTTKTTRRAFLSATATASVFTIVPRRVLARSGEPAPSEKLNIGCVGVGGMAGPGQVHAVSGENIYAACDVDEDFLNRKAADYSARIHANQREKIAEAVAAAKKYRDFREMLDKEQKNLHGITITIPDHMHATVALWAMERGIAVYCQKPLTQTVWEARLLTEAAQKYKVATQMGNQGYSSEATRVACEIIWRGDIGDVTEVHAFGTLDGPGTGRFAPGITEWPAAEPVPPTLNWDLWTGRAAEHAYSSKIAPIHWRAFQEYGTEYLGDWGVHVLGPANWALQLGAPTSVECTSVDGVNAVTYPHYSCKFEFPERPNPNVPAGKMPPVTIYWYPDREPKNYKPPQGLTAEEVKPWNQLFIGTKGFVVTSGQGTSVRMLPEARMKEFKKPDQVIKRSPGHHEQWIQAVKRGEPTCSNFTIAGSYVEWLLLGTICWRFPNEKLLWDSANMRFTNNEKANEFVRPHFRKGWELRDVST